MQRGARIRQNQSLVPQRVGNAPLLRTGSRKAFGTPHNGRPDVRVGSQGNAAGWTTDTNFYSGFDISGIEDQPGPQTIVNCQKFAMPYMAGLLQQGSQQNNYTVLLTPPVIPNRTGARQISGILARKSASNTRIPAVFVPRAVI